jgi:hypothetical protein
MTGESVSNCTSGCRTKDHASYADCLKGKGVRVGGVGTQDRTAQKKWDADLDAYSAARRQGIQPASTKRADVDAAVRVSEKVGRPYDAGVSS